MNVTRLYIAQIVITIQTQYNVVAIHHFSLQRTSSYALDMSFFGNAHLLMLKYR